MLTKRVNCYLKILMFAHKSVTNTSKAIDTSPYSMHNALQKKNNVLLRTCHLNYSIGNVSIVSYFAHKLLIILKTNKTNPNAHLRVW